MSLVHNRKTLTGSAHSFAHFLQEWQYVCAQFSAAEWNVCMSLYIPFERAVMRCDRILPVVDPLVQNVKHYSNLISKWGLCVCLLTLMDDNNSYTSYMCG